MSSNYMVDPNTIITKFNMKVTADTRQMTLGMVKAGDRGKRFYFSDYGLGPAAAVSSRSEVTMGALSYMRVYNEVQVTLNELLKDAGAILSDSPTIEILVEKNLTDGTITRVKEKVPVDIDLSIEAISKDTLIDLFTK